MRKIKLLISEHFGNKIFTRSTISSFFDKLRKLKEEKVVLDFKGIDFISRSCADEYLKKKQISKKKIIEVNMSEEVCAMFRVVENQYKKAGFKISFEVCPTQDHFVTA